MSDTALPNNPTPHETFHQTPAKPKKKKRIFMWFFLAVQALFVIWLIAGLGGADAEAECAGQTFNGFYTREDCIMAFEAGTGIGVGLVFILWLVVDFILVMGWAVVKLARR